MNRRAPSPQTIVVADQFTVFVPADPLNVGDTLSREELADETLREFGGIRLGEWEWQPASKAELLAHGCSEAEADAGFSPGSQEPVMRGRCYAERGTA